MITPTAIDLSSGTLETDSFVVDEFFATIQASVAGVDGDFDITPVQSNDDTTYCPIYDYQGNPIVFPVRRPKTGNALSTFTRIFNISKDLYTLSIKLVCSPISGKFAATKGTVTFTIKTTEAE